MKKIYAFVTCKRTGFRYAAHIPEHIKNVSPDFCEAIEVSKAEYQRARANGMPSWGETQVRRAKERTA